MESYRWDLNLKVRLFGEGLFNLLFWMYFPFITVYFAQTLGVELAGLLMAVPPLFLLVGSLIGGSLADEIGRRPVMLFGTFAQAVLFLVFALSTHPYVDYVTYIGIGFMGAIYKPASSAMVADLVPTEQLRDVFATFMASNNIGAVLGPILGGFLFFEHRQALLFGCAFVLFGYGALLAFLSHETKPASTGKTMKTTFRTQVQSYRMILRDRLFRLYLIAGVFALIPIMQLDVYLPVYLIEQAPAMSDVSNTILFGWLVAYNGLLFVVFIIPVTRVFRAWDERRVFILSTFLAGFGTFLVAFSSNLWYLFLVTTIFTFGELIRSPVSQSFISRYAPASSRGQYLAADTLQNTVGKFLAPVTVVASGFVSPFVVFTLILLSALIGMGLYANMFTRLTKEDE
ncbi:MDR family MFS transporter [Exiguobacterium alkaliphilum]|uniref:MDR family MFS transporter n=1 Tax=Exiguobacterium alkaliphilum TaxID=1428684 RepID=UPI001BA871F2|nr:MFS transporter [Exiguobacterium alkaliphilum]QUE87171.1 MFS transporter [Exiguobacterium alkaliphilum]